MVSVVRPFVMLLAVLAFAVAPVLAENAKNGEALDSEKAELVAEIAVRDSVMALHDSACTVEKKSLRSDLEVERAKCENWEQSYNTLKKSNETCAKALSVALEASQEQAQKDKKEKEEKESSDRAMASVSLLGSVGIGMLIMWLIMK
jgi:hypothetical protein